MYKVITKVGGKEIEVVECPDKYSAKVLANKTAMQFRKHNADEDEIAATTIGYEPSKVTVEFVEAKGNKK